MHTVQAITCGLLDVTQVLLSIWMSPTSASQSVHLRSHMADLPSLQPRKPGRVGSGLGFDFIRVEVLPALREPRPVLGFQSQLGPQRPELVRMSAPPHAGAEDDVDSASAAKGLPEQGHQRPR